MTAAAHQQGAYSEDRGVGRLELRRQLRWLMTLRVVTVSTLLFCAFGIELMLRPQETLAPLFWLTASAYGMVLLYAVLHRWMSGSQRFVLIQLIGDALLITAFVQTTGGLSSPMSFLYLLPISVASIVLYRGGGLLLAAICWALYAALAVIGSSWIPFGTLSPVVGESDVSRTTYQLVAHLVGMLAFALLSSYLSERLRIQGRELVDRQRTVVRLQALNENIIESINSGLVTTDLEGRVNFMNRGGAEILGQTADQLEGCLFGELFGLGVDFVAGVRQRLQQNRRFRFERYYRRSDGFRIFLGIAVSNLHDKAGRPLGYIFIFQDLTEIHALELEVRLKERMAALGEMAAGMAHEVRNPLASISGAVQYLKGDLQPEGETLELMDIILRESHRLDHTIRDFLTFARPGTFATESVDLVKLIESSLKLLTKSQQVKNSHRIETKFEAPSIEWSVDPNRMTQVFWNLTTNALKAMPDGGTLTVEVATSESGRVVIRFSDDGVGMDAEQQQRYFQPFSSSFVEGTGLGAAIVYRIVDEHAGKIYVESAEGQGACVTIELPPVTAATLPEQIALDVVGGPAS